MEDIKDLTNAVRLLHRHGFRINHESLQLVINSGKDTYLIYDEWSDKLVCKEVPLEKALQMMLTTATRPDAGDRVLSQATQLRQAAGLRRG